jgi:hypothetical protein
MVNFKKITDKAKDVVEKRGGTDSLKQDAGEIKDIFKGEGTFKDKAKAAASAVKDPGQKGAAAPAPPVATEEQPKPGARPKGEARRKAESKTEDQRAK